MSLQDDIQHEIDAKRLLIHWTTSDLVNNVFLSKRFEGGIHSIANLRTTPSNRSCSLDGLGLGNGANNNPNNPAFYRVGLRDRAIVYSLPRHKDSPLDNLEASTLTNVTDYAVSDDTALEFIVEDEHFNDSNEKQDNVEAEFSSLAVKAINILVDNINEKKSWDSRLADYIWKKKSFFETQSDLSELIWRGSVFSRLILENVKWTVRDQEEAVKWAAAIFDWGGTRQKKSITWEKVSGTLENALKNRIAYASAPINSGYTKVASFGTGFLEEDQKNGIPQVINDSRVAASLISRLEEVLVNLDCLDDPKVIFPGLGYVDAARGGSRPRPRKLDWPNAYQSWRGQFAATKIVAKIRDILNEGQNYPKMPCSDDTYKPWTIRGVEAVLFMDGY